MIQLNDVSFEYVVGEKHRKVIPVISEISTTFAEGQVSVLVGPSGCGKTTLLNIIAGVLHPVTGSITYADGAKQVEGVGYVFQTPSLIPWRTIRQNALFGAEISGRITPQVKSHCDELLHLYGVEGFENSYPSALSVGMQQRVSIIRAVISGAKIILLDEPFSNSDFLMRRDLHRALSRLVSDEQLTAVMVTHDIEEAARIGDKVIVLTKRPATIKGEINISVPREERIDGRASSVDTLASYVDRIEQVFSSMLDDRSPHHVKGEGL